MLLDPHRPTARPPFPSPARPAWAFATGSVTIHGRAGAAIDKHQELHVCERPLLRLITTGAGTIGADGMLRLPVEALLVGARYNLLPATILMLTRDRDGLTLLATVNDPGLTGGADGAEIAPPPSPARLAAAAPALFAALAGLIAVRPDNWDDDDDPEQRAAWRAADAAIDAANGLRLVR